MKNETKNVKTMTDAAGNEVPAIYVKKYDKLRDKLVRRTVERWRKARQVLDVTLCDTLRDLEAIMKARQEETGSGIADKGNFRVSSFDGNLAVELRQSYRILLDDRVKEAQRILIEWASRLADKIEDREPRAIMMGLIQEAFSANASGSLPVGKILSLLQREIPAEAKRLLEASIHPEKGKCYVAVMARPNRQQDMKRIALDVADCWPESGGAEPASQD